VSKVLIEYVLNAIEYIAQSQTELCEEMLTHCEEIIISASKQSILVDPEVLALISHTSSLLLYQYLPFSKQDIKSSAISLFKSIQMFKQRSIPSKPLHQIMQSRVLCSLHLQLFGLYSSTNNHDLALLHIKEAFNKSEEIISKCASICHKHLHRHKNLFPSVNIIS
jgi:hypothetical protein